MGKRQLDVVHSVSARGRRRAGLTAWAERHIELAPTSGTAEPHLDGLRGVAVLGVVMFHVGSFASLPDHRHWSRPAAAIIWTGQWGVQLFFVLSGYLLARPWFVAELRGRVAPSTRKFYLRRFTRIAPGYYVSMVVVILLFTPAGLIRSQSLQGTRGLYNLGAHVLFLHHMLPITSTDFNGTNGVYWTLTTEMTFYLVLPFAARAFVGRRWRFALGATLLGSLVWVLFAGTSMGGLVGVMRHSAAGGTGTIFGVVDSSSAMRSLLLVQFPSWLFTFALGVAGARLAVHAAAAESPRWWSRSSTGLALTVGGAAVIGGAAYYETGVTGPLAGFRNLQVLLSSMFVPFVLVPMAVVAAVYGLSIGPRALRRLFATLPLRYLGWTSFGVYLYHVAILVYLEYYTGLGRTHPGPGLYVLYLAITLSLALVVATLSWLII